MAAGIPAALNVTDTRIASFLLGIAAGVSG
jgi:hypothetical protein